MAKLKVDRGEIFFQVLGEGQPVVMLRGLGRSIRHWLGFEKKIAEYFRVICIDARGIGRSSAVAPWALTIDSMASDVALVLDHLEIPAAHLFGISLGGMVALSFGMNYPDRALSITAINASVGAGRNLRLSPKGMTILLRAIKDPRARHDLLAQVLLAPGATDGRLRKIANSWRKIESEEGTSVATVIKQLGAAIRFWPGDRLAALKPRTMIVVGTADQFVPPDNSRIIHRRIPGAELVEISGAGHELNYDKPDELADAFRKFAAG